MIKNLLYALFLCIYVNGIYGCKKYYVIDTIKNDGHLIFKSNEILKICDGHVYVHSFGIEYIGKKEHRRAWRIVRKKRVSKEDASQDFPLKYGDKSPEFETSVEPMEILPGKYRISSDLACYSGGNIRSLTLFGSFFIDANNNLILDGDNSNE
ncbi:hypothetical protein MNBD_GAMMA10-58 [hydrothermal vent metagenome]|uniref:Lipoprotein n=1 Tax=hydrothermal vent metagenome TaxID=652676 RepID=A0A3B0XRP1_9ZZZZ